MMLTKILETDRTTAEAALIEKMSAPMSFSHGAYDCPVCLEGQVTIQVHKRDRDGRVIESAGCCCTPGCLDWPR